VEVIHTIIQSLTEDGRDRSLDHKLTPIHVPPSLPEGLPPPELGPIGDEILLPKSSSGVFNSTNLDYLLKNLGIRHLVVAGILTDHASTWRCATAPIAATSSSASPTPAAAPTAERHENALRAFAVIAG